MDGPSGGLWIHPLSQSNFWKKHNCPIPTVKKITLSVPYVQYGVKVCMQLTIFTFVFRVLAQVKINHQFILQKTSFLTI